MPAVDAANPTAIRQSWLVIAMKAPRAAATPMFCASAGRVRRGGAMTRHAGKRALQTIGRPVAAAFDDDHLVRPVEVLSAEVREATVDQLARVGSTGTTTETRGRRHALSPPVRSA